MTNSRNAATQLEFSWAPTTPTAATSCARRRAQEAFALRNQPINEIMALFGGSQVNMP